MRLSVAFVLLVAAVAPVASARTLYVAPGGNDGGPGTPEAPLATLQAAANLTQPGDIVQVAAGSYSPPCAGCDVVDVTTSGTAVAPITYTAAPGAVAVLPFAGSWQGIHVDASWIVVNGFQLAGGALAITKSPGLAQSFGAANNGNGVRIDNLIPGGATIPAHVTISNNVVHDAPGNGIEAYAADYVTISGNVVYGCANWSPYADSGISVFEPADSDGYTGVKIQVLNNLAYHNRERVPFFAQGKITDGNGIIIDDASHSESDGHGYAGRILVQGNISYLNGGSGIHAYASDHVDIVHNTAYLNDQTDGIHGGQIYAIGLDDTVDANIAVAPAGKPAGGGDGGNFWVPRRRDPMFRNPSAGDFSLLPGSPAAGLGALP